MIEPLPEAAALLTRAAIQLKEKHHFLSSYTAAKRAMALAPGHPAPEGALGAVLWNLCRFEEGVEVLNGCIAKVPDNAEYWAHKALCHASLSQDEEAEAAYTKAVELSPKDVAIRWNRSQFRLARGDWTRGFEDYETRIEYRGRPAYPKLPSPLWQGEDLNGKTLLIQGEQGVGDTILSARYIPLIKERWPDCKIVWYIQPRLHDLFWEYRDYVTFNPASYPWPKTDYSVFQMSLLRLFGSQPETVPLDPGLIRKRALLTSDKLSMPNPHVPSLKIGIAWTGNPEMMANYVRSVPLEAFMPLAEDPRFTFYSLQVGEAPQHIHMGGAHDLIKDCSPDLQKMGFAGTAAVMMNMDLVLTVCTSAAHMAGVLGVPCWTMLAQDCYWVWGREGTSTPWYPGMKLFRQTKNGDWDSVITRVEIALDKLARQKGVTGKIAVAPQRAPVDQIFDVRGPEEMATQVAA